MLASVIYDVVVRIFDLLELKRRKEEVTEAMIIS